MKEQPDLSKELKELFLLIAKELRIDKLVDWLERLISLVTERRDR